MTIYIAITAHNERKNVINILDALEKQTYKNFKVVLVDDGSSDGTSLEVEKLFPGVTILKGDGNLWWGGATAWAVDHILLSSRAEDFILFLNNDLSIDPSYLDTLVSVSNLLNRAIVGSLLRDRNDAAFKEGGVRLNRYLNCLVMQDHEFIDRESYDLAVDVLPGRGTLIPIEVFHKIGNINAKQLPHYFSDYEFTLRAKRAGYTLAVAHRAPVFADLNKTGLSPSIFANSIRDCFLLLFSKRSKINLLYLMRYAWLCSEKNMRWKNTFFKVPTDTFRAIFGQFFRILFKTKKNAA